MTAFWLLGLVAGLGFVIWASGRALERAVTLGEALSLPPFVVGATIVAVGTDLPEIANSIVASARGLGDVTVGNSVGSVVTQLTVVTGLLCFVGQLHATRTLILTLGAATTASLLAGAALLSDGSLTRTDGVLLVGSWAAGTLLVRHPTSQPSDGREPPASLGPLVLQTVGFLLLVGVGAAIAVESFVEVASAVGAPEYLLSFFVLAAGTSLPELVVDVRALRIGQGQLAMGDLLGSSFVDATLSPGIGPLLFPTAVSAGVAGGTIVASLAVAVVTVLLWRSPSPGRRTGAALIAIYLALYPLLLS